MKSKHCAVVLLFGVATHVCLKAAKLTVLADVGDEGVQPEPQDEEGDGLSPAAGKTWTVERTTRGSHPRLCRPAPFYCIEMGHAGRGYEENPEA